MGSSPTAPTNELPAEEHFSHSRQEAPGLESGGFGSNAAAVGYVSASSIAAAALSRMFGSAWEYVSRVMAMDECRSISETIFGFTLRVSSSVANVCRRW